MVADTVQTAGEGHAGRVVVCAGGGDGFELPPATHVDAPWVGGGIRSLYELAFALAASGRRVELRGPLLPSAFEELARATGVRPELPQAPRRPAAGELVVVPEGHHDPLFVGRVVLSHARAVLLALAPPGLFGWPLTPEWTLDSALTVERGTLARPEHFQVLDELGIALWTPMARLQELAREAGTACTLIGNGSPGSPPASAPKRVDVAWLRANRWAPWAEQVAARLGEEISVDAIEEVDHDELLRRLGAARVLLWPSRIEGHARISAEARGLGCVPVALASNEFATGLDEDSGAVVVDTLEAMGSAVAALLRDPDRLAELAARGRASAARQLDWDAYVARVADAAAEVDVTAGSSAAAAALGEIGGRAATLHAELKARCDAQEQALADVRRELHELYMDRDRVIAAHATLRGRKSVRLALRVAALKPRRR